MKVFRSLLIAGLMLTHLPAHATSFDCNRGRSLTERMICNDPALSKLDDTLGQLYWKARRRVIDRRAFLSDSDSDSDSDSKWAWREANCRDLECLGTWYATRIDELQRLIESMRTGPPPEPSVAPGAPATPVTPVFADDRRRPSMAAAHAAGPAVLQCTAANPGLVVSEQCSTVIGQSPNPWHDKPRDSDWFCGVAMLAPPQMQADAAP
ncbi:lysozyme inhibitor LprI family protein [Paraburkholderia ribeironis]|nr:hypothetical protein [Paraburkholderia ribeironis]